MSRQNSVTGQGVSSVLNVNLNDDRADDGGTAQTRISRYVGRVTSAFNTSGRAAITTGAMVLFVSVLIDACSPATKREEMELYFGNSNATSDQERGDSATQAAAVITIVATALSAGAAGAARAAYSYFFDRTKNAGGEQQRLLPPVTQQSSTDGTDAEGTHAPSSHN